MSSSMVVVMPVYIFNVTAVLVTMAMAVAAVTMPVSVLYVIAPDYFIYQYMPKYIHSFYRGIALARPNSLQDRHRRL